ncbi:MAG: tetratricopeptide repeat protein [Kiritimatiellae bacterium]|nr:tetratricopeptide repeat protein [Kiritimatiellia bacterium]
MEHKESDALKAVDWIIAGAIAVACAVFFMAGYSDYAIPGESAALLSHLKGLGGNAPSALFPVAGSLLGPRGGSAAVPLCGAFIAAMLYLLPSFYLRRHITGEYSAGGIFSTSRIAGVAVALTFALSPAVRLASTHFNVYVVDCALAAAIAGLVVLQLGMPKSVGWLVPAAAGVLTGLGSADTMTFMMLMPLYLAGVWAVSLKRGGRGYGHASLFLFFFFLAGIWCILHSYGSFGRWGDGQNVIRKVWFSKPYSFVIPIFVTLPFVLSLFSIPRSFKAGRNWIQFAYHGVMTLVSILALATDLSAASQMHSTGYAPVFATAFAAFTAGYLIAYWWSIATCPSSVNESLDEQPSAVRAAKAAGLSVGGAYAVIMAISLVINLFLDPETSGLSEAAGEEVPASSFADVVARRIVEDMGPRTWLVTDPRVTGEDNGECRLETHLRLAADRAGKELHFIQLERADDRGYVDGLASLLESKGVEPRLCSRLRELGLYVFLQDWFSSDPQIKDKVAVYGVPELLRAVPGTEPVPELFFFGADPARAVTGLDERRRFAQLLKVPDGWGSWGDKVDNLAKRGRMEYLSMSLRQHLGFVSCSAGALEQKKAMAFRKGGDEASAAACDARAFDIYEFVLREVDRDNIVALINETDLAERGCAKAASRLEENRAFLAGIASDAQRRYSFSQLAVVYGEIMNPDLMLRAGLLQADLGNRELGLATLNRLAGYLPDAAGDRMRLMVLAPRYAQGDAADREKARREYDRALAEDPGNYPALVGHAQLAILDGDIDRAISLLDRAVESAGDDPRVNLDRARLRLMRGDLAEARKLLVRMTDENPGDTAAWALRVSLALAELDSLENGEKSVDAMDRIENVNREIDGVILPKLSELGPADPACMAAKALVLRHRGGRDNLSKAKELAERLVRQNPRNPISGETLLETMVGLEDSEAAVRQAEEVLRNDPSSPIANWVLGSVALQKGDLDAAEDRLRKAIGSKRFSLQALNDLAECLRLKKDYAEAEKYARRLTELQPKQYIAWETLGSIILDSGDAARFEEAEKFIQKAWNMSRNSKDKEIVDYRMVVSLARAKFLRGDVKAAGTLLEYAAGFSDRLDREYRELFDRLRKDLAEGDR